MTKTDDLNNLLDNLLSSAGRAVPAVRYRREIPLHGRAEALAVYVLE